MGQAFLIAYRKEKQKVRQEEEDHEREGTGGTVDRPVMSPMEAVQLLGLEVARPELLSPKVALPLMDPAAREAARQAFQKMFAIAVAHDNMFLAGKLSAAYRQCVDPLWDQPVAVEREECPAARDEHNSQQTNGCDRQ